MNRYVPYGYGTARGGTWTALFIMGWDAFLMTRFLGLEGARTGCVIMTAVACILALLFMLSDVTTNLKRRGRIKQMNEMLAEPYVCGSILRVYYVHKRTRKELTAEQLRTVSPKEKLCVFEAEYTDPVTGERRTVTSEPYVQDLNVFLSGKSVEVHYTPDGEVWAEPAEYRESMEQESIGDDKKRTDRRYWVSEHAVPLALGVYAFAGLVIYLIFRSF